MTAEPQREVVPALNTLITSNTEVLGFHFKDRASSSQTSALWAEALTRLTRGPGNKTPRGQWGLPSLCSCAFPLCRPPLPHPAQSLPFNSSRCGSTPNKNTTELTKMETSAPDEHLCATLSTQMNVEMNYAFIYSTISISYDKCWFPAGGLCFYWQVPVFCSAANMTQGRKDSVYSWINRHAHVLNKHLPVRDERGEWGRGKPEDWPLPIRLFLLLVLQLWERRSQIFMFHLT